MLKKNSSVYIFLSTFLKSVWFFPVVLLVPVIIFTSLGVSGSSQGFYHEYFFGSSEDDPNLIAGRPRQIRSDEWLVNTQLTISQVNNDFARINENIGNGHDMSLIIDAPYREWSVLFKPHQWAFFVMPAENAFAFRWWFMGYLLIVSVYFFVLKLLPDRKKVAVLLGLIFFFSPFIQWWYLVGTLGTLYWGLAIAILTMSLISEKSRKRNILWSMLLAYCLIGFALILYPPFQIPVALVVTGFLAGYLLEKSSLIPKRELLTKLLLLVIALLVSAAVIFTFLHTRQGVVETIQNTAYPGQRTESGGHYDKVHFFSNNLSPVFQWTSRSSVYKVGSVVTNQSETSNFLMLAPWLLIPGIIIILKSLSLPRKKKEWLLILTTAVYGFLLLRMFGPTFLDTFFEVFLLNHVPLNRMLIGFGLLNLIYVVLVIRALSNKKLKTTSLKKYIIPYCVLIFSVLLWLGYYTTNRSPGFIDPWMIWLLAIPIPMALGLLLYKKFVPSLLVLLVFSVASTIIINPLYKGLSTLTETDLSTRIQKIELSNPGIWATETILLENFATINGARSISGVYSYPQLDLWTTLDDGDDEDTYNRYAHATFSFDRDPQLLIDSRIELVGGDHFQVYLEPCSSYLEEKNVRYLLTVAPLDESATCANLINTSNYPAASFYIYELDKPHSDSAEITIVDAPVIR